MTKFSLSYELGTRIQIQKTQYLEKSLINVLIQYSTAEKRQFSDRHLRHGM